MSFDQWLVDNDYDAAKLTDAQRGHLEAGFKALQPESADAKIEKMEAMAKRVKSVKEMAERYIEPHAKTGNVDKVKQLVELRDAAVNDDTMTTERFHGLLMQHDRMIGAYFAPANAAPVDEAVVEAAFARTLGLSTLEKDYPERTLEAAQKKFKHGLGIRDLLMMSAERNAGYRGSSRDLRAVLKAAFRENGSGDGMYAGIMGPSTIVITNILANVANKFMRIGFDAVDQSWREISAIGTVSDYKPTSTLTLTGDLKYEELGPDGEITHGTLGEVAYSNQASIYARMIGLDERNLRNDDAGVLASTSTRLGRGAALALNHVFWTEFLNNSSFFTAGNSNVITGGTSVLSGATGLEALRLADLQFRNQTDPDGMPIGSMPKILLVPNNLRISALNLMNSTTVVGTTTANSLMPDQNAFAGAYRVVSSPYMNNTSFTGSSATAWYILAEPNDLPVIETVFVDGQQTPQIDQAEGDFNMLGIMMRGVLRFGCNLQEYRAGIRAAGA